jgi:biopolymer transport protein ExbD
MSSSGKKKGMPPAHGSEVNVTPLIDVIMCLIIFFMLVAKIGVSNGDKPMDLPYTVLGKTIDDMGNTLSLNLLPVGKTDANKDAPITDIQVTALVDNVDKDLPITMEIGGAQRFPLREVLVQMKARYKDQFKVIVRADGDLPFTQVQKVLVECANAGASSLLFAAKKGEEPAAPEPAAAAN